MKKTLKKYFIPHSENNYHPHILHTKRAIFYSSFFLFSKILIISFAILLPNYVFVLPDILAEQQSKLFVLTNNLREQNGLPNLEVVKKLNKSSQLKAVDMANKEYFSHVSPNGKGLAGFLSDAGYQYDFAGENLALGFSDADELMDAWIKSPTHYSNLIDSDYKDFGVGLENGIYEGQPTVYVAEHFGAEQKEELKVSKIDINEESYKTFEIKETKEDVDKTAVVLGEKEINNVSETVQITEPEIIQPIIEKIKFNRDNSKIYWEDRGSETILKVRAEIFGNIASAMVAVDDYLVELKSIGDNKYSGDLIIDKKSDDLFKVVIFPSITIVGKDGYVVRDIIDWNKIKIVSQTPIEKYVHAKKMLGNFTSIFSVSKSIYLFFIVFFSLVLLLNILVEIKKQHPHIIAQTLGLIGLLICLFVV